jgi:hypothetical protein
MQKNRSGQPPLIKVSIDSFIKAAQLQRRAMSGSEPELLVAQQATLVVRDTRIFIHAAW